MGRVTADIVRRLAADPGRYLELTATELYTIPREEADRIRLEGARKRFADLKNRVAILATLAGKQCIPEIRTFEDLAPLLIRHDVYKSYPISWLERSEFTKLTKWLGKITTVDLSSVDVSGCELIDEWIAALRKQTPIGLCYSAGADGKMAFLPRTESEWNLFMDGVLWTRLAFAESTGAPLKLRPGIDRVRFFYPHAKKGARPWNYFMEFYEKKFGEGLVSAALEKIDTDLMSLAGRIQEASKKGEQAMLQVNPKLLARKEEIARINRETPCLIEKWVERLINDHRGERIFLMGSMGMVYDLAKRLREKGIVGAYAPDSVISAGGGFPGGAEPEGWEQEVCEVLGINPSMLGSSYGMSEMMSLPNRCRNRKYHLPATTVPFLLDVESGQPLPRTGRQTGRFAFLDLLAESYWGGYVSSDLITITWDEPCGCGFEGPFLDDRIRRVSTGGDDKIGCAGSPKAHDEAAEFLLRI